MPAKYVIFSINSPETAMQLFLLELILSEKNRTVQNLGIVSNSEDVLKCINKGASTFLYAMSPLIYRTNDQSITMIEDILKPLCKHATVTCLLSSRVSQSETDEISARLKEAGIHNVISASDTLDGLSDTLDAMRL